MIMKTSETISGLKQRDSGMELLRIIAMLLVCVVHCNFVAIGTPTQTDIATHPISSLARFFTQSVSIICVNLFVLISGWYGIRPTRRKFANLLFQVAFYSLLCFVVFTIISPELALCFQGVKHLLLLSENLWFIKSYIFLFVLAPVLNAFVETASQRQFAVLLVCFFAFQFIYGWMFLGVVWFTGGYSTISFVGLYLLARYARVYLLEILADFRSWLIFIGVCSIVACTFASYIFTSHGKPWITDLFYCYNSPFSILTSVCVAMSFIGVHFYNRAVNFVASGAFAVYLLHCNPFIFNTCYTATVKGWFATLGTASFVCHCALLVAGTYVFALAIDQIRLLFWRFILRTRI